MYIVYTCHSFYWNTVNTCFSIPTTSYIERLGRIPKGFKVLMPAGKLLCTAEIPTGFGQA